MKRDPRWEQIAKDLASAPRPLFPTGFSAQNAGVPELRQDAQIAALASASPAHSRLTGTPLNGIRDVNQALPAPRIEIGKQTTRALPWGQSAQQPGLRLLDLDVPPDVSIEALGSPVPTHPEPTAQNGSFEHVREPSCCAFDAGMPTGSTRAVAYWDRRSGLGRTLLTPTRFEETAFQEVLRDPRDPMNMMPPLPPPFARWNGHPTLLTNRRGQVICVGLISEDRGLPDERSYVVIATSSGNWGITFQHLEIVDGTVVYGGTEDMPHACMLGLDEVWITWGTRWLGDDGADAMYLRGAQIDANGFVTWITPRLTVPSSPPGTPGRRWWPRVQARSPVPGEFGDPHSVEEIRLRRLEERLSPVARKEVMIAFTVGNPIDRDSFGTLHACYAVYDSQHGWMSERAHRVTPPEGFGFGGGVAHGGVSFAGGVFVAPTGTRGMPPTRLRPLLKCPPRAAFIWNSAANDAWIALPSATDNGDDTRTGGLHVFRSLDSSRGASWAEFETLVARAGGFLSPDLAFHPRSGIVVSSQQHGTAFDRLPQEHGTISVAGGWDRPQGVVTAALQEHGTTRVAAGWDHLPDAIPSEWI